MNEQFISYIWFNKLYFTEQKSLLGEKVEIISPGIRNRNSGPDAFNAKIKIFDKIWAGNVEFHTNASDWHKHNHDGNKEYDNIILHVVANADEQIFIGERAVTTIELQFPQHINIAYNSLQADGMRCTRCITAEIELKRWIERLVVERLEEKTKRVEKLLQQTNGDYEEALYILMARSLGFGTNSDAMEALAKSVPLKTLLHHRDNPVQIEAMLLGQAGFLFDNTTDSDSEKFIKATCKTEEEYIREYKFLKNKFSLEKPKYCNFKLLRMRPSNFPALRIAQLAAIIHNNENLFNKIVTTDINNVYKIIINEVSDYWKNHYIIGKESHNHHCNLTKNSCNTIIINAIIPFLFVYGKLRNDPEKQEKALNILQEIKAEKNHITERFNSIGIKSKTAFDSQALIQLQQHYCDEKRCLECQIGYDLIKKSK